MKKPLPKDPLPKEALLAACEISKAGQPVQGEPTAGCFGVRPRGELPADVAECARSLRLHFPKCLFAWLPPRPVPPAGAVAARSAKPEARA